MSHVVYMKTRHLQLCQPQPSDMFEGNQFGVQTPATSERLGRLVSVVGSRGTHVVQQLQRFRNQDTQNKRYRAACKVCSALKDGKRAKPFTYFCSQCRNNGPVFLCLRPHREVRGLAATCWNIWHRDWKNGRLVPLELAGQIRHRRQEPQPLDERSAGERTPTAAKRRRTRDTSGQEQ
ncbi:hypothetical protein PC110_g4502 [Phytophthora cactorum]|uniref:PiggyBac transposable element-derived protein 4 C-terminal zinc-ribbon domain-containing protein n=1 Tax=Phytophthora cactorum TaxID=29920 RepID=A0A329SQN6_9STRA|nr:hypothetical protein PC110_g4502 [Phytophthora cactorum]